jgi:hypothetical protein
VRHHTQPGVAAQPPHVVLVQVGATMHRPPVHCCPVGHALPQAPQCVRLVCVSTHVEPQRVCPEGQHERGVLWQKPEPRVWHWSMPAKVRHHTQPRTLVHAPHVPPLQDAVWQRPETHVWPEAHTVLQPPQWVGSVCRSEQVVPQRVRPLEQQELREVPAAQKLEPYSWHAS